MLTRRVCLAVLTAVVIEAADVTFVLADMQILESNVPAYRIGIHLFPRYAQVGIIIAAPIWRLKPTATS
jgi:hypothetical protein